jgi:hypothetical protein
MYFKDVEQALHWAGNFIVYDTHKRKVEIHPYKYKSPTLQFIEFAEIGVRQDCFSENISLFEVVSDIVTMINKLPQKERKLAFIYATRGKTSALKVASSLGADYQFLKANKIPIDCRVNSHTILYVVLEKLKDIMIEGGYLRQ